MLKFRSVMFIILCLFYLFLGWLQIWTEKEVMARSQEMSTKGSRRWNEKTGGRGENWSKDKSSIKIRSGDHNDKIWKFGDLSWNFQKTKVKYFRKTLLLHSQVSTPLHVGIDTLIIQYFKKLYRITCSDGSRWWRVRAIGFPGTIGMLQSRMQLP